MDDFDGLLQNLPDIPFNKRGRRCSYQLMGGDTEVKSTTILILICSNRTFYQFLHCDITSLSHRVVLSVVL